ncbi:MAG: hypothetical protein S0880_00780 [Actinomycetota bacterium]|nr:hypothetical protein [Actinomycetota bacterium]
MNVQPPPAAGDLNEQLHGTSVWSDEMVAAAGIPIVDVPVVTIGGGIGSFVLADMLRISGVPIDQIAVLTTLEQPWATYEYLARVSQIPAEERIRSDSAGMPDNIWGVPSYALIEAWREKTLAPLWAVATEPVFGDYWTPRASTVFRGLAREMERIGWSRMLHRGNVRLVRRRHGGGYFSVLTPPAGTSATRRVAYRSRFAHIAVGYPGLRFLPDLQEYRERTGDRARVVNAYEPHEHVYESLLNRGGTVMVRGGGIVSSRVLQRLMEDRMHKGAQTHIVQLLRTYVEGSHGSGPFMRRKGGDGFAYQGFNWPKSSWGGQLRVRLERLDGEQRKALYDQMGGSNTPKRKLWQQQMAQSRAEGWYSAVQGVVTEVQPTPDGRIVTRIRSENGLRSELVADHIIDATGLEADIEEHRLLADLLRHGGAGRNPLGRLDVTRSFEIIGTRAEPGRLYASGSMTLGGPYSPVDSFAGLQYSALKIADDLAGLGFTRRIGVARSIGQWWRWAQNRSVD